MVFFLAESQSLNLNRMRGRTCLDQVNVGPSVELASRADTMRCLLIQSAAAHQQLVTGKRYMNFEIPTVYPQCTGAYVQ